MAGVSEATASRVMNGRRYVAAATRQRVQAAARELDYVPHHAARELSMARTATVALLVHHAQYPVNEDWSFSARVLHGVARTLHDRGYDLLYLSVDDDAASRLQGLAAVRPGRSDGALLLGPAFPRAGIQALKDTGRPVVLIDNRAPSVDAVMAENRAGATALTRHLVVDHGYRRLACLAGPVGWPSTAERVAGTRRAAHAAGAELRVIRAQETTIQDGAEAAGGLLDDPPDAIIAVNDAMAIGAMQRLRSLPTDGRPAVVGFDNSGARLTDPPLTTVAVDAHRMGATAAELLLERISARMANQNQLPAREIRVPATLRLRRSCGCGQDASTPEAGG
jgi:LacI family transcriptional regulator